MRNVPLNTPATRETVRPSIMQSVVEGLGLVFDWVESKIGASVSFVFFVGVVIALAVTSSCSLLESRPATAQLAVQYAVFKLAEQSSDAERPRRLNNIEIIAASVKGLAASDETTLADLQREVNGQIDKLKLSPADNLLAKSLANLIADELRIRISNGLLKPDDVVQVARVMDWVIEAAEIAGGAR